LRCGISGPWRASEWRKDRNRQQELGSFLDRCDRVGFRIEPLQAKIAGALLGWEREKLITLQRKNGKARVVGTFAAHHVLTTPEAR
jgi:hypothetical protein